MGSSIQLPSQRQVGTTHTILQVGPFLPTYRTMRIVFGTRPTPYLMQVECPKVVTIGKRARLIYNDLRAAGDTPVAERNQFGKRRPGLNPWHVGEMVCVIEARRWVRYYRRGFACSGVPT
jgi:hypothetical protein